MNKKKPTFAKEFPHNLDGMAAEHFRNMERLYLRNDIAELVALRKKFQKFIRELIATEREWRKKLR